MSKKFLSLGLILALMLTVMAVGVVSAQDEDLSGTTVTIFGAYTDESEVDAFNAGFEAFEEETGIDVVYEGASDFEVLIQARVDGGDPPDIAGFPQPGLMCRYVEEAVPVTDAFETEALQEQYANVWLDLATCSDGTMLGVWGRVVNKSLVWYNPQTFADFGYEIPTTWEELLALSDTMVADGNTPWSVTMESGAATGWVGTDWIEDIVLRTTTLDNYDAWATPTSADERLPFSSPEITRAWELFGDIVLNEDYVLGGPDQVLSVSFFDIGVPVVEGDAMMTKMGSFVVGWTAGRIEDLEVAEDGNFWYFPFPPIDEEFGTPLLASGDIYTMFNDRPEVRAVMEHLTTAASLRPAIEDGIFVSPHLDQDLEWYRDSERGIAEAVLEASEAGTVRFDGGDLMPGEVGTGTFWTGVVDYVRGAQDLEAILAEIDESWPE